MVRGNWQRRVEKTEARRAAAKERKQKKDSRAGYKSFVSELYSLLGKQKLSSVSASSTIHLWTDTIPADAPPILDLCCEEAGERNARRKGRSSSFSTEHEESPRQPSKKAHPRSREDPSCFDEKRDSAAVPCLCRNQFFRGICHDLSHGGRRAVGCRHVHYAGKQQRTLSTVLGSEQEEQLREAEEALLESDHYESIDGGMFMLYYFAIELSSKIKQDEESGLGQILSDSLAEKGCGGASLVYVTIENHLIYDRYRDGVQRSNFSLEVTRMSISSHSIPQKESRESCRGNQHDTEQAELPSVVLEYILTFLPDASVASMSQVCRSWHQEIGNTPYLWKHLLQRRNWPLPPVTSDGCFDAIKELDATYWRDAFLTHYEVVRDFTAVRNGLPPLMSSRNRIKEIEMVYHAFSTRRHAPVAPNSCVAMCIWASDAILAAYSHDCSLRLFKSMQTGHTGKACRELVSVCVDPNIRTKKRKSLLVAMALDDDMIGCLLYIHHTGDVENSEKGKFILVLLSRDEYLVADGTGSRDSFGWCELDDGALHTVDIGESTVNYFLSEEFSNHQLPRLVEYLAEGGELEDVEVLASPSVVACGQCRFLLEVTISVPNSNQSLDNERDTELLARKFVIFNSSVNAIVWASDSTLSDQRMLAPHCGYKMYGSRYQQVTGRSAVSCSIVVVPQTGPQIMNLKVNPSGHVNIDLLGSVEAATPDDSWQFDRRRERPIVLMNSDVVIVEVISQDRGDESANFRSVLSFFPHFRDGKAEINAIVLEHCQVLFAEKIYDDHLLLLCEELESNSVATNSAVRGTILAGVGRDEEQNQFENLDPSERIIAVNAVVMHVPTRQVIQKIHFPDDSDLHELLHEAPIAMTSDDGILAFALGWKGVVLSGKNIRGVGTKIEVHTPNDNSSARTKKKRMHQSNRGKKDAFARGMSLRG